MRRMFFSILFPNHADFGLVDLGGSCGTALNIGLSDVAIRCNTNYKGVHIKPFSLAWLITRITCKCVFGNRALGSTLGSRTLELLLLAARTDRAFLRLCGCYCGSLLLKVGRK
jgi:hypothetical protein